MIAGDKNGRQSAMGQVMSEETETPAHDQGEKAVYANRES